MSKGKCSHDGYKTCQVRTRNRGCRIFTAFCRVFSQPPSKTASLYACAFVRTVRYASPAQASNTSTKFPSLALGNPNLTKWPFCATELMIQHLSKSSA